MREIKFRAFVPATGKMVDLKAVTPLVCNDESLFAGLYLPIHRPEYILMQFTGLKDKNGVEIYEGDILATSNDGQDGADVWAQEVLGDVYWSGKFACWNHRIDLHNKDSMYSLPYIEVIGNMYENPDLLKLSKN